jgi:toxin ParE1/3/4
MSRFSLSHLARADLAEIREFVAHDEPEAARRLLSGFFARFQRLAQQPELGEKRDDLRPNLRGFSVGHYVVFISLTLTAIQ